jgi:hypothetical protein
MKKGWLPGQSGNPAGRPKGAGLIRKMRSCIVENMPSIVEMLIEQARRGDVTAAKLLFEHVLPAIMPCVIRGPVQTKKGVTHDDSKETAA